MAEPQRRSFGVPLRLKRPSRLSEYFVRSCFNEGFRGEVRSHPKPTLYPMLPHLQSCNCTTQMLCCVNLTANSKAVIRSKHSMWKTRRHYTTKTCKNTPQMRVLLINLQE